VAVTLESRSEEPALMQKWLPVIDVERCTGCDLCVEACGPACLEVIDAISVLVNTDTCGSEEHCIEPCRDDAIHMDWVTVSGDPRRGRWRPLPV
jgi:MinD superfamily P-loop ATPase